MRRKLSIVAALTAAIALAAPVSAITNGVPDEGEHPYVGQLLFYVPDVESSFFEDPGGWFSCSGTLVSPTVVVTAGHCTFAIGQYGVSTTNGGEATTAAEGGVGGNDVWVDFSEEAHFDGWPATADYEADENPQRYIDRSTFLETSPFWQRGTSYPHPEYDDNAFSCSTPVWSCSTSRSISANTDASRVSTTSSGTARNLVRNIASKLWATEQSGSRAKRSPVGTRG